MVEPVRSQKMPATLSESSVFPFVPKMSIPVNTPVFFSQTLPSKRVMAFLKKKITWGLAGLFLGVCGMGLSAYHLLSLQEKRDAVLAVLQKYEQHLLKQKRDLVFLKKNKLPLDPQKYLEKSEKLTRLEIGEMLKTLAQQARFQGMTFTVIPEKKISLKTGKPALLTKISVFYKTHSDTDLVGWIKALEACFPLFLVPQHLTIERTQTEDSVFQGVEGVYIFDWVSIEP